MDSEDRGKKRKQMDEGKEPKRVEEFFDDFVPKSAWSDPARSVELQVKSLQISDCKQRAKGARFHPFEVQQDAISFMKDTGESLPLFAHDIRNTQEKGPKKYIVANYDRVFAQVASRYSKYGREGILPGYYEIMMEDRPCHLFVDLEYDRESNQELNDLQMLRLFLSDFKSYLKLMTINDCDGRTADTLVLYSPDKKKVSYHVHIIGKFWIFKNHYHCGALMRNFVMWTIEKYGSVEKNPLFVKQPKGDSRFFADCAVYTNHRVFRSAYSAKWCGKTGYMPLLLLSEWDSIQRNAEELHKIVPDERIFLKSNPMYVAVDGKYTIISVKNPDLSEPVSTNYMLFYKNNGAMKNSAGVFVREGTMEEPIVGICLSIVHELINMESSVYFVSHCKSESYVVVGTYSKRCPLKEKLKKEADHKSNHVHYVVHYARGFIRLKCADEECQNEKARVYKIDGKWANDIVMNVDSEDHIINEEELILEMNKLLSVLKKQK
jgi:hypothetical protein